MESDDNSCIHREEGITKEMKDLTKGNPLKLIIWFALPIALGNLFQQFYNMADTRIVGSYLGENSLAAVGSTNSLNSMIIGFLLGMTNGFAIITARKFGAKNEKDLKRAVAATFEIGIAVSLVLTIVSVVFLKPIMEFLNTPETILAEAMSYFRIILVGMTFSMLYNVVSGILRAIGDAVTPLCFLIFSALCNVGLDLLFVRVFHIGVAGAALATIISQGLSFFLCLIYMWVKYPILRFGREDLRLKKTLVGEMLSTGVSMGFMISFINIGSVALQTVINTFGENTIVAHTAARKITEIFMLPFSVFGAAMATFAGQNMGAGRIDRVKTGLKQVLVLNFVWSAFVFVMSLTIVPLLIQAVTATDVPEIIDTAAFYLRVDTSLYWVTAMIIIIRNTMQGIGDSKTPIISSFIELASKVLVAILLAPKLDYFAIVLAEPISWVLMVIPLLFKWRKIAVDK